MPAQQKLHTMIVELAAAEVTAAAAEDLYKTEKAKYDRALDPFRIDMADKKAQVDTLREQVRAEGLRAGGKTPHPALTLVQHTEFTVTADEARAWTLLNMPGFLDFNFNAWLVFRMSVDDKKTLQKQFSDIPGEAVKVPFINISPDLSVYVPKKPDGLPDSVQESAPAEMEEHTDTTAAQE